MTLSTKSPKGYVAIDTLISYDCKICLYDEHTSSSTTVDHTALQQLLEGDMYSSAKTFCAHFHHNPLDQAAYCAASSLFESLHAYKEAEAALRLAVSYFPNEGIFWMRLSTCLLRSQDPTAQTALHKAMEFGADKKRVLFVRCFLLIEKGHYSRALKELQQLPQSLHRDLKSTVAWGIQQLRYLALVECILLLTMMVTIFMGAHIFLTMSIALTGFIAVHYLWRRLFFDTIKGKSNKKIHLQSCDDHHYRIAHLLHH